jgi:hypothetical protein
VRGTVGVFGGKGAIEPRSGRQSAGYRASRDLQCPCAVFGPRGADIDSRGVVWVSLSSGHLGCFDRRKCKGPLNGPKATGDQCPEGWTLQYSGPGFAGVGNNSAEASYYTWVDQHNTLGLGDAVPISTGNENDAPLGTGQRQMGRDPRAVSAQLLRQGERARAKGKRLGRAPFRALNQEKLRMALDAGKSWHAVSIATGIAYSTVKKHACTGLLAAGAASRFDELA